jgi:hypothetical protein
MVIFHDEGEENRETILVQIAGRENIEWLLRGVSWLAEDWATEESDKEV